MKAAQFEEVPTLEECKVRSPYATALEVNVTPTTTDEQIYEWVRQGASYNWHVVENMLFLERRVAQLEEKLKAIDRG